MLVKLVITPSDILVYKDNIERKTTTLLRAKRSQLKKLEIGVVDNDLFDFKGQEHSNKIEKIKDEINKLENGIFEYYVPPKYINKIKKYLI